MCGRSGTSLCPTSYLSPQTNIPWWTDSTYTVSTNPVWRVDFISSCAVANVEISLAASHAGNGLKVYLGNSSIYAESSLCAIIPARTPSQSVTTLTVACSGVGRYLHIAMPGENNKIQFHDVSATGCVIDSPPAPSSCPVGKYRVGADCLSCPAGWTTDGDVTGPDMWQGCNVACSAAMMADPSSGCKGAWFLTGAPSCNWPSCTYSSCSIKCSSMGLTCSVESLIHSSKTVERARRVLEITDMFSSCASLSMNPGANSFCCGWLQWGVWRHTCGGCPGHCYYAADTSTSGNELEATCDGSHHDANRACPCALPKPTSSTTPAPSTPKTGTSVTITSPPSKTTTTAPQNPTTTPPPTNVIATAACPVGYGRWNATTCRPCPVGWTTTSGGATQDMWQGCTVPCSETMMSNAATGCKGAWYQTLSYPQVLSDSQAQSCTAKCAEKGLRCNWQALNFTSTVGHARSVFEVTGVWSSCDPDPSWTSTIAIGYYGPDQETCGGCRKRCFYQNVVQANSCDMKHMNLKRLCPCSDPSVEGREVPVKLPLFFNASVVRYPSSYSYPWTYATRSLTPVPGYAAGSSTFTTIDISNTISSDRKYEGGVVGPNGLIYFVPSKSNNIGVLNPSSSSFTTIDISNTISWDWKYAGGVLGPNGLIYFVPRNANNIGVLNPSSSSFTTIDISNTISSGDKYEGGVLGPDGLIYFVPLNANNIGVLNPSSSSFTTIDISNTISSVAKYFGGVLGPNGLIYFVPHYADNVGVLNPSSSSFTTIDISNTISWDLKYAGGVLGPNGLIYFVPHSAHKIGVLNPSTSSFTTIDISNTISSGGKYEEGVLGPNGLIYFVPWDANNIGKFHPGNTQPAYEVAGGVPESWSSLLSPHFNKF
jgi:streptogramin lyase